MLRTIVATVVTLLALLLLAAPEPLRAVAQAPLPAPAEHTLTDGDAVAAEMATRLAADDDGEEAASAEGPPPLFAGVPARPVPERIAWPDHPLRLHARSLRPLLPPPRTLA